MISQIDTAQVGPTVLPQVTPGLPRLTPCALLCTFPKLWFPLMNGEAANRSSRDRLALIGQAPTRGEEYAFLQE